MSKKKDLHLSTDTSSLPRLKKQLVALNPTEHQASKNLHVDDINFNSSDIHSKTVLSLTGPNSTEPEISSTLLKHPSLFGTDSVVVSTNAMSVSTFGFPSFMAPFPVEHGNNSLTEMNDMQSLSIIASSKTEVHAVPSNPSPGYFNLPIETGSSDPATPMGPIYHLPHGILTPTVGIPNMTPQPAPVTFIAQLPQRSDTSFQLAPIHHRANVASSTEIPTLTETRKEGEDPHSNSENTTSLNLEFYSSDRGRHLKNSPADCSQSNKRPFPVTSKPPVLQPDELDRTRSLSPTTSNEDYGLFMHTIKQDPRMKDVIVSAIAAHRNIYIRGLQPHMTDEKLFELCRPFGKLVSAKAILEQTAVRVASGDVQMINGICKGYGFAMFENEDHAKCAIEHLGRMGYDVSLAKESFSSRLKSLQDSESSNLYLSNIPLHFTELDLNMLFSQIQCHVVSSRILRDNATQISRGVGFARLESRANAIRAIDQLNGIILDANTLPLQLRFADNNAQKKLKSQTSSSRRRIMGQTAEGVYQSPASPSLPIQPYISPYSQNSSKFNSNVSTSHHQGHS